MNFLEELTWRGMIHDTTTGIEQELATPGRKGYIGFDPTAPSLTIGNLVQIMLLTHFGRHGHQPIMLMGGATGRIGDPSGKDKERDLKSIDELNYNLEHQQKQAKQLLEKVDSKYPIQFVNNYDFYKDMNVLDYLRDIGKTVTVNYMMAKDSVKNRLDSGLSFTEFSYQLLQGYDFAHLYNKMGVTVQMGGSDQFGNITTGTEVTRKLYEGKVYAVTTPLLTKPDGSKFGKSSEGNVWLDGAMTSPYKFYQYWINVDDAQLPKLFRYFSLKSQDDIKTIESDLVDDPQTQKKILAEELTTRIHTMEDNETVQVVTELLFSRKADRDQLLSLTPAALRMIAEEIPSYIVPMGILQQGIELDRLLTEQSEILASKSLVRNAVKGNALALNKQKATQHDALINTNELLHGRYIMVENGKKNKYMIIAE